ncbi:hypothetical protein BGX23_009324 [Mortierella sp. AD031]|nr:hypothetical protein BGX23_009324 [Mortierella sp. AD031]
MTQQVDLRSPAVQDLSAGFEFQSQSGPGGNTNNSGGGDSSQDRWPSLLNARQVFVAFILEMVSRARPLQEKLNIVILRAWHLYLAYARTYPLLTNTSINNHTRSLVTTKRVIMSAVPFLIFASITGVSLGLLVGTAAVVVIIIQSIVVSVAGAILLFILGIIVILTLFAFFWLIVGYFAFQFVSNVYASYKDHKLRQEQETTVPHEKQQ